MPTEWNLYYEGWMISDGEPDLSVGEVFDWFAIEFWSDRGLLSATEKSKSATEVPDFEYGVSAELVYLSEKACVIDFGLNAVGSRSALPPGCKEGDYVAGQIAIGIPGSTEIVPDRFLKGYLWRINRITADLTPFSPDTGMLDRSRTQYRQISSTKFMRTHSYILHCSALNTT